MTSPRVGTLLSLRRSWNIWSAALAAALCLSPIVALNGDPQTVLFGAGATFPYPIYVRWINVYQKLHPEIAIGYEPIGSEEGILEITGGKFDFGASDIPMNDGQLRDYRRRHGMDIRHFATVVGADIPIYNLPGISAKLRFTPEILAAIFLGKKMTAGLQYAPLPRDVVAKEQQALTGIQPLRP